MTCATVHVHDWLALNIWWNGKPCTRVCSLKYQLKLIKSFETIECRQIFNSELITIGNI